MSDTTTQAAEVAQNKETADKESGFSLMEVLIALAIIASLAAIVGPRLTGHVDRSKVVSTQSQAKQIKASLGMMQMDIGRYPTQEEGLALLVQPGSLGGVWRGPYLDGNVPTDAWGNAFSYTPPASNDVYASPKVVSFGADGVPGGDGLNADIEG